jgi:hypothetical protein
MTITNQMDKIFYDNRNIVSWFMQENGLKLYGPLHEVFNEYYIINLKPPMDNGPRDANVVLF